MRTTGKRGTGGRTLNAGTVCWTVAVVGVLWPVGQAMAADPVLAAGGNGASQLGTELQLAFRTVPISDVEAIAGNAGHTLALKSDKTVWAWGANFDGQIGDGTTDSRLVPVQVSGLTDVRAIAAGTWHSLAVTGDGNVWTWGRNDAGQLIGTTIDDTAHATPAQVSGLTDFGGVAGGPNISLAIRNDGTLWKWGEGRLPSPAPGAPAQIQTDVAYVSVGTHHRLAIKTDRTVYAWGGNFDGQLGLGTTGSSGAGAVAVGEVLAVAAGARHSLAVKDDGTVWAWGNNDSGQLGDGSTERRTSPVAVSGLSNVAGVAGGEYHSLAIRNDGTVWVWGTLLPPRELDAPTRILTPVQVPGITNAVDVLAGEYWSLILLADGSVLQRDGAVAGPQNVPDLADAVRLTAGRNHSLALRPDGSVWAWGANRNAQLGNQTPLISTGLQVPLLAEVIDVAAGAAHSLALGRDGTVSAWGSNDFGQLGSGVTPDGGIAVPNGWVRIGPVDVQYATWAPALVEGTIEFQLLYTYHSHWFDTFSALLGIGGSGATFTLDETASETIPIFYWTGDYYYATYPPSSPNAWTAESHSGYDFRFGFRDTCTSLRSIRPPNAVLAHFVIHFTANAEQFGRYTLSRGDAFGDDSSNYFAESTTGYKSPTELPTVSFVLSGTPQQISNLKNVVAVAAGGDHSLALTADGSVWAWGCNEYGQLGDGSTESRTTAVRVQNLHSVVGIAAGRSHSLAVRSDGSVWAWGANNAGQLGDGNEGFNASSSLPVAVTGLSDVKLIAAGDYHSLAVKADGTAWAWGDNGVGQLGDGTWGEDNRSSVPVQVSGLSNVIAVSGGRRHSLAATSDGTAWAWGYNADGRLGSGTTLNSPVPVAVEGVTGAVRVAGGGSHSLIGTNDTPPAVLATWPGDEQSAAGAVFATVSFTEPVTNVTVDDLAMLVGEAVSSSGGGAGPYFFRLVNTQRGPNAMLIDGDITDSAGGGLSPSLWTFDLTTVMSDLDADTDVDGFDFLTFANCFNGVNRSMLSACLNPGSDIDADGDVDGFDFLTFANCYNGSDRSPLCP